MNSNDKNVHSNQDTDAPVPGGQNVLVKFEDGIAWITLNRPDKRNSMSPSLNNEMISVLNALEEDSRCGVLVLTGEGEAFSAGMDLKEYFRDNDGKPPLEKRLIHRAAIIWQWNQLYSFPKPTIAMVNGWCFGGAFTPLVACDLAIASDDAVFGLSEINWGIMPAGGVPRALAEVMNYRDALYYIMTGETFNGQQAAQMGLVNESVPHDQLRDRTRELAKILYEKSPTLISAAKISFKNARFLPMETAWDYICARADAAIALDPEGNREKGLTQFLDDKSYRPGLGIYKNK